jgi:OPA family glycerol-3-phosphate transporter-like MFS transporter
VIGVHGIMSGTATMDFGGSKNTGTATGMVDGVVYMGTAVQSFIFGRITPTGELAADPTKWIQWPILLIPVAVIGFLLTLRIWNARPRPKASATEAMATATPRPLE